MSLEIEIQKLTAAVENLTFVMTQAKSIQAPTAPVAPVVPVAPPAPVAAPAPVVAPAPVAAPAPVVAPAPVAPPAVTMPALPTFMAPPVAAPAKTAPFSDGKGLIQYVMDTYNKLGAEKGKGIQAVMASLGYQHINDVKPEHYGELFEKVEAIK